MMKNTFILACVLTSVAYGSSSTGSSSTGSSSTGSHTASTKACMAFKNALTKSSVNQIEGRYSWQKTENYCKDISDEVFVLLINSPYGMIISEIVGSYEKAQKWPDPKDLTKSVGIIESAMPLLAGSDTFDSIFYYGKIDKLESTLEEKIQLLEKFLISYRQELPSLLDGTSSSLKKPNIMGMMPKREEILHPETRKFIVLSLALDWFKIYYKNYLLNRNTILSMSKSPYCRMDNKGFTCYKDDLSKPFLDIMPSDYYFETHFHDVKNSSLSKTIFTPLSNIPAYAQLRTFIDEYHKIPKTRSLKKRIEMLKKIASLAAHLKTTFAHSSADQNILETITSRANIKASYIEKISREDERTDKSFAEHPNGPGIRNTFDDPLIGPMTGSMLMSKKSNEWEDLVSKDPNTPHLLIWLENLSNMDLLQYNAYKRDKKKFKRVIFKDGIGFNEIYRTRNMGHIADGRYGYNLSLNGDLYVAPAMLIDQKSVIFPNKNPMRGHAGILGGVNLLSAGFVDFTNGRIVWIDISSGHYIPTSEQFRYALSKFVEKYPGAILDETMIEAFGKSPVPYKEFITQVALPDAPPHQGFKPGDYEREKLRAGINIHNKRAQKKMRAQSASYSSSASSSVPLP